MKRSVPFLLSMLFLFVAPQLHSQEKMKALILDGQNNHSAWPKTTMMMKKYLEQSGLFEVDVARTKTTWQGKDLLDKYPLNDGVTRTAENKAIPDPDFKPKFGNYKLVINNLGYGAAKWPKETQEGLHQYMMNGGGLVIVHAADNSFGDWDQYNRMIGLGGWGDRTEKSGPYVYMDNQGKLVRDESAGKGGSHGSQHEFTVVIRNSDHPITKGIPKEWLHAQDELYDRLRGPAENMTVLATAFSSKEKGGTDRHEPMLMTIDYGKGRVFHTPMGHEGYSMECVGFITLFLRGSEWAATGKVTKTDIPSDFPTADKSVKRKFD